jgi:hypothetical protein
MVHAKLSDWETFSKHLQVDQKEGCALYAAIAKALDYLPEYLS